MKSEQNYLLLLEFAPKAQPQSLSDAVFKFSYFDSLGKQLGESCVAEIDVPNSISNKSVFELKIPANVCRLSLSFSKSETAVAKRIILTRAICLIEVCGNSA